jgi:hypothetical protein
LNAGASPVPSHRSRQGAIKRIMGMLSSSIHGGLGRLGVAFCLFAIAAPTLAQDDPPP